MVKRETRKFFTIRIKRERRDIIKKMKIKKFFNQCLYTDIHINENILSILLLDFTNKYSLKYIYSIKKKNVFFDKIIKYLLIFNISY